MRQVLIGMMAAGLLSAGGTSWAQPPAAVAKAPSADAPAGNTVDDLTVIGRKSSRPPPTFNSAVTNFVGARAQSSGAIGNLSRWRERVCPFTAGLTPEMNAFVSRRVMDIAARVGAPQTGQCKTTNVLVVFTTAPQKVLDDVRREHPKLLGYHYYTDEKALATFHGPVEAWHATATRDQRGALSRDVADAPCDAETCIYGTGGEGRGDSRLKNGFSSEFMFALVVIQSDEVDGQPIGAVADMAATLALADTGPRRGCSPLPSVLDALDPACPTETPAETLTAYDEAFLKGLYASDPENLADVQRTAIARNLHNVTKPPPGLGK